MKVCTLSEIGGYENFSIKTTKEPSDIGENEILLKHSAIGINFDDIMYRKGIFQIPKEIREKSKEIILGFEGAGIVQKVGSNVKGIAIGDQVGYGFCPFGAYAQYRVIDYRYTIAIPEEISLDIAAATLRKGMTAEYLLYKAFRPIKGDWIMIHSIAGGVGHLLAKWAKFIGLKIIGTVGDESKISFALATGCDFVINRKSEKISDKVREYTNGMGVKGVFDGIGKAVFEESIASLSPFGVYISYGYAGGLLDAIDPMKLREKNLFFTAPTLEMYKHNRYELIFSSSEMIETLKKGIIHPSIARYAMEGIPQAHADMESGKSSGSIVINVY
jgi:NADPH:quinone reductase